VFQYLQNWQIEIAKIFILLVVGYKITSKSCDDGIFQRFFMPDMPFFY
jgi:hypothetical protein